MRKKNWSRYRFASHPQSSSTEIGAKMYSIFIFRKRRKKKWWLSQYIVGLETNVIINYKYAVKPAIHNLSDDIFTTNNSLLLQYYIFLICAYYLLDRTEILNTAYKEISSGAITTTTIKKTILICIV